MADDENEVRDEGSSEGPPEGETAKWKSHSRRHEARAKASAAEVRERDFRIKALQAELALAEHAAETARAARAATELKITRREIAEREGVPEELLVNGNNREEIERLAELAVKFVAEGRRSPARRPFLGGGDSPHLSERQGEDRSARTQKLW